MIELYRNRTHSSEVVMLDHLESVVIDENAQACKFVLFVAVDQHGNKRFFIRGQEYMSNPHVKIKNDFLEEVGQVPGVTIQVLGGAYIGVRPKVKRSGQSKDVVIVNMSSDNLGKVRDRDAMLRLLQEKYPNYFIDYRKLE